jgi:hypothetical protein
MHVPGAFISLAKTFHLSNTQQLIDCECRLHLCSVKQQQQQTQYQQDAGVQQRQQQQQQQQV